METIAVIKTGGKQYKVRVGDTLKVEKLINDKKNLEFADILNNKKVIAEIISEGKLDKVRILKFHRRKRYRRNIGHRQEFSQIKIKSIE
ncbi:MAG: ribosomal protein large subunit ribosomal protein [Candidatus Berkelbacteria bacterium]|nr:ribosomal protein large subunit ribosomal protein [Candidatus Berkelbacteria bacterium]